MTSPDVGRQPEALVLTARATRPAICRAPAASKWVWSSAEEGADRARGVVAVERAEPQAVVERVAQPVQVDDGYAVAVPTSIVSVRKPRLATAVLPEQVIAATGVRKTGWAPRCLGGRGHHGQQLLVAGGTDMPGAGGRPSLIPNWMSR